MPLLHVIFYIQYFTFFQPRIHELFLCHKGTKSQRNTKSFLILVDDFICSPLPPGEGLGVRLFFHENMIVSFPK